MKAVTFHGPEDVRVESVEDPAVQDPGDAVLRVTRSALCGSDLHVYRGDIPGVLPGSVVGHEYAGVVEEVGADVRRVEPGDRVTGAFHVACGGCPACRRGDHHQCDGAAVFGYGVAFGDLTGAQAERLRVPHADVNLRQVPPAVSDEKALFAGDILSTAFGALRKAGLEAGEICVVVGCGPVGLLAVQCAALLGAARVVALDLVPERLSLAEGFGALPVNVEEENPASRIRELTEGQGADVVVEAVGGVETLHLAFDLVRGGGRISAVGVSAEERFEYPLMSALTRDIQFRIGLANVHRDIDRMLALLEGGRVRLEPLVSHRLPLEEAPEAYRLFHRREATKVILTVGDGEEGEEDA